MFLVLSIILFVVGIGLSIWAIERLVEMEPITSGIVAIFALLFLGGGWWAQTHRIVSTQYIGISRNTFSQELNGLHQPGLMPKPFFGSVYQYPASSSYEKCEQYTPAIKGSYGITIDLCFYYDVGNVDWLKEVNRTGSLSANEIMKVWRNSVVGDVARSVKDFTPEALSDNRATVEQSLFENISPWFAERGIPLARVSFKNWDFTSPEVASSFDASIVSQRKITEQTALFEAAKISRQREKYEAETIKIVAGDQREALDTLGLGEDAAIQYLWIKALSEGGKMPDVLILGTSGAPVAIPLSNDKPLVDISVP